MPSRQELKALAQLRLREAEALHNAGLYDGAAYLAGYAVEMGLKACICRLLGLTDYPSTGVLKQTYAVHDLDLLVLLAGLKPKLRSANAALFANWSLVQLWKPDRRYTSPGTCSRQDALDILNRYPHSKGWDSTMDHQVLVKEMRKLARELRQREGPLVLFMLVSPDPAVDNDWNIVVSAQGFNRKTRAEGIREFTTMLRHTLSMDLWPQINRVTVLRTDDPFVEAMTSTFPTQRAVLDLQTRTVVGFEIPKALVFASQKVAA